MEKEIMKVYTAEVPYTLVLFGKSFPVDLEMLFEYAASDGGKFRLEIKSLTGTCEEGFVKDYSFLVDEDTPLAPFVIDSVVGNRKTWTEVVEEA